MRLEEDGDVKTQGLKMVGLIEKLAELDFFKMNYALYTDLLLHSLSSSFKPFIDNYHMNKLEHPLHEHVNMLKTSQMTMKK